MLEILAKNSDASLDTMFRGVYWPGMENQKRNTFSRDQDPPKFAAGDPTPAFRSRWNLRSTRKNELRLGGIFGI